MFYAISDQTLSSNAFMSAELLRRCWNPPFLDLDFQNLLREAADLNTQKIMDLCTEIFLNFNTKLITLSSPCNGSIPVILWPREFFPRVERTWIWV